MSFESQYASWGDRAGPQLVAAGLQSSLELQSGTSAMWHHAHSQKHSTNSELYGSEVDFNISMRFNLNESGL
jgi:hypothetical protein